MATHDYIISNASGASVRADLNNALAAIVSNNSNATSPATTYPYQWWADTTTGQLKLRNSANSAWITIFELDGTMLMEDGTVSAPGLAFASDLNTGFFRSAADKINFATGGAERLEIGSSEVVFNDPSNDVDFRVESNGNTHMLFVDAGNDRVGIGTSGPSSDLDVFNTGFVNLKVRSSGTNTAALNLINSTRNYSINSSGGALTFYDATAGSERARIDSSGRLLLGHSSSRTTANALEPHFQMEGINVSTSTAAIVRNENGANGPILALSKSRGTSTGSSTIVQSGDVTGAIHFAGADGTDLNSFTAWIQSEVDGTPGSNDMPGRLVFYTSADNASSPSERLRIDSSGNLNLVSSSSTLTDLNFTDSLLNVFARVEGGKSGSGVGDLRFHTYSGGLSEAARIDSSGNMGVGTTPTDSLNFSRALDLNGANGAAFYARNNGSSTNFGVFGYFGTDTYLENKASGNVFFKIAGSEKMRLSASGQLLVGTTTEGAANADNLTIADSGHAGITVRSGTSSKGAVYFSDGTSGAAEYQGVVEYDHSSNALLLFSNAAEGLRVDSSQRVGIGTTSPAAKLQVKVGTNQNFAVTSTSGVTQLQAINDVASAFEALDIAGSDIRLSPSSAERARVTSGGYFKAAHDGGYANATGTWHEFTGTTPNGYSLRAICDNGSPASHYISELKFSAAAPNNGNAKFLQCADGSGARINLDSDGGIHNYQSNDGNLCDEREKKNIVSLDTKWDKVKSWELKKFHYNEDADTDDLRYGVIAQQVEEHCPEVLTDWIKQRAEDAVLDDDGNVVTPAVPEVIRKGVKEQQMMWMAIKALQEAQTRIETLEAKVAALEAG